VCEHCHHITGHDPRCPLADPVKVYTCDQCGNGIYEGDLYMEFHEELICESCVDRLMKFAERNDQ